MRKLLRKSVKGENRKIKKFRIRKKSKKNQFGVQKVKNRAKVQNGEKKFMIFKKIFIRRKKKETRMK